MDISFIGGGKRVENYFHMFENKDGFNISGFYSNPIKDCADIAIKTNTCIFSCIDDLCNVSDIIFIATEDEMVPYVIKTLTKLHIHGKIIITVAKDVYASDIDNGYENTYAVIDSIIPFENIDVTDVKNTKCVINGFGKQYDNLITLINNSGVNIVNVSKPGFELFRASCHLMTYGIKAVYGASQKLCKIATDCDDFDFGKMSEIVLNDTLNYDCPYKNGRLSDIKNITDILTNNGIDSITALYRAIGEFTAENSSAGADITNDIYNILRK